MMWSGDLPFFTARELSCRCGCGQVRLDQRLAAALPALRLMWGGGLTINSCCRCGAHNTKIGGHPRSLHLTDNPVHPCDGAMAVDIAWRTWPTQDKLRFARLALAAGWAVGLHNGFCHVDRRLDMGQPQSVFLYGDWDGAFQVTDVHGSDDDGK